MSKLSAILAILIVLSLQVSFVRAATNQIDKVATVSKVVDGDTFDLKTGGVVRLADINTPEIGEAGYSKARDYLINLIEGKTVYLDIDNMTTIDQYGRLVCLVYVDYNSSHYLNVNKALLVGNYAVNYDFNNNDFSPSNWTLYVAKNSIPELTPFSMFPLFAAITLLCFVLCKRKRQKCNS